MCVIFYTRKSKNPSFKRKADKIIININIYLFYLQIDFRHPSSLLIPVSQGTRFVEGGKRGLLVKNAPGRSGSITALNVVIGS